jgi:hypothetical protein
MGKRIRIEWLKFVMRYNRPKSRVRCARQVLFLITFEVYYGLCRLRGYPARHFLDPMPEEMRGMQAGERVLLIWPRLPLSIRLLDRIFYRIGHAGFVPYTWEAASGAEASGMRAEVIAVAQGELHYGGRFN